jgi:hypothetical protein
VRHLESGEHQTVIVNGEETAGHLTGDCANVVGAAAIGGPFFVRPFLSERDFAKPTTSITIPARAAYPHAAAQIGMRGLGLGRDRDIGAVAGSAIASPMPREAL